ncbi:DgyrCDS14392 [Dimorphilus gyrociliatus]|uniref:DgyrCDS14392 n=1 Tax=Dimorphilus gyrociliatus TaxID=2664684 RepID=A0A7I8WDH5_9ANNE|nr:DgyrCDS14392 [Dimorphilus gyrociliatus]
MPNGKEKRNNIKVHRARLDISMALSFDYEFCYNTCSTDNYDCCLGSSKLSIELLESSVDPLKIVLDLRKDLMENPVFICWYDRRLTVLKCPYGQLSLPEEATESPVEISLQEKFYKVKNILHDIKKKCGKDEQAFVKSIVCKPDGQTFTKNCKLNIPFLSSSRENVFVFHKQKQDYEKVDILKWDTNYIEILLNSFSEYIIVNIEGNNKIKFYVYGDEINKDTTTILRIFPQVQNNQFDTCFTPQSFFKNFTIEKNVVKDGNIACYHSKDTFINSVNSTSFKIWAENDICHTSVYSRPFQWIINEKRDLTIKFTGSMSDNDPITLSTNNEAEIDLPNTHNFVIITNDVIRNMASVCTAEMILKLYIYVVDEAVFLIGKNFEYSTYLSYLIKIRSYLWEKLENVENPIQREKELVLKLKNCMISKGLLDLKMKLDEIC